MSIRLGLGMVIAALAGCGDDVGADAGGTTGTDGTATSTPATTETPTTAPAETTGSTGDSTTTVDSTGNADGSSTVAERDDTTGGSSTETGDATGTDDSTSTGGEDSSSGQPNTPPLLGEIDDLSVLEDESSEAVTFFIGDNETGLGTLVLTTMSSDETLIPADNIVVTGEGPGRTIQVTPAADLFGGPVTVTVSLDDGDAVTEETFDVTVLPVNDPPTFVGGADLTVAIDAGGQLVPDWATMMDPGPGEGDQTMSFAVTATESFRFEEAPAVSGDGDLTLAFRDGRVGVSTVTVTLVDDGGTANGGNDTSSEHTFAVEVACASAAPPADYFVGDYAMEQLSGEDPLFGGETFGGDQTVAIALGNAYERTFDFLYSPGSFDHDYNLTMTLCEDQIRVDWAINNGALGCGTNIGFSTGIPASAYNLADDATVAVDVTDFEPNGSCDAVAYPVELLFTAE